MMKRFDTPYMADWFAISLRWVMLVGLIVSLGLGQQLDLSSAWTLGLLILWNLTMTALAGLNMRTTYHRRLNIAVDLILTGAFFWVQGGIRGPAFWAGLLPILTGSIYFEIVGAVIAALLFSALVVYTGFRLDGNLQLSAVIAGIMSALGILFGILGRRLMTHMRQNRALWVDVEEKKRAIQNERMRAIYELTSTLSSTLSYKRVLDSALDMSAAALNPNVETEKTTSDPLVGAVMLFNAGKLRIGSARRFTNADMRITFDGSEGVLKKALDEGEPVKFKDIGYDAELGRVVALRSCTSGYVFPLRSGFNVYGVLIFAHPEAEYFTTERTNLLDIIGRQAVIAIQNARLYQDLVEEKERLADVYEEARKKLARDLHDGPTQSVAAMAMRLNISRRMLAKNPSAADAELVKLEELAHRTTTEIRHMLFTLRPLILESQGLAAAIQSMADKMMETFSQRVVVEIDERASEQLEMGKQGVIFYIIEEAVNNARKHAAAEAITVRLRQVEPGIVLLEIADNGAGFDVKAITQNYDKRSSSSLGMVNLRERAELVNGLLNIDSKVGKGTNVQVYIPLTEDAADRLHNARRMKA
ncbi:MAG: GAF domain-containing protein [Anaerolineales bacterium]|jgi:signal transduction histidine kinase|uniref:GAF domain-containing sensor histidine kinase n=1 Tax=Candidatus Villigracilis vicinus TaxID=3140679 RepID=UPI00313630B6|nr:GAF domain-containing protein [Anaerolineales bacterium]MBK7449322.1 GAF domain-containing protein [Anaerolineales bacterium]MBK9779783.1 GAF domain-containing protein [Anaerolineales bacterium]